jgi:hypothetical protein
VYVAYLGSLAGALWLFAFDADVNVFLIDALNFNL